MPMQFCPAFWLLGAIRAVAVVTRNRWMDVQHATHPRGGPFLNVSLRKDNGWIFAPQLKCYWGKMESGGLGYLEAKGFNVLLPAPEEGSYLSANLFGSDEGDVFNEWTLSERKCILRPTGYKLSRALVSHYRRTKKT